MNDTTINISGITILHEIHEMQDTTDTANVIVVKDDYGKEVRINICFGKIINIDEKNSSSKQ